MACATVNTPPESSAVSTRAAVMAVADYAQAHADQLVELDVNPVLVLPKGRGVLAVDALIRLKTP